MLKFLKGVVASAGGGIKDLPYNIGEPYSSSWGSWAHCRGTSKDDNAPVSIFSLTAANAQDGRLAPARNGVKRLRTVRHPNISSYLHSTEAEGTDGKLTIYIVTEPVMPLAEKLKELNLTGNQRDEYFAWGLHQISKAVSFLNNDCKLVHGNVCLSTIVVTPTLDWKLHAFDVLSEFDTTNPDSNVPMLPFEWLISSQYKAMELAEGDWATIRKSPPWALDSWGLGCLIFELFAGKTLAKADELRNTTIIPKLLLRDYQRLLSSVASRRLNPSKLIDNSEFFQNKLVETIQFMEVLSLKDSVEKDSFFRKLPGLIEQLPREIALKKILPMLASALEFGSASATALNPLLKMASWLSQDELTSKVAPTVVKLFSSTDRAIRVGLLQNIEQFGNALPSQVVDEQVFMHLATGFTDASALLRELTLKSMLILAPKLSQRTITGSLLKHLSKLQVDEEPGIRTNTTILLGNLAGLLNEATRKRVLINAFTVRALRDTFPPARGAGILALNATSQYYDIVEIATRILPSLVVLTIDSDSDVRTKAFETTEIFLQLIRKLSSKLEDVSNASDISMLPVATSGLLGWAVSSLKNKPPDQSKESIVASTGSISSAVAPAPVASQPMNSQAQVLENSSAAGWGDDEQEARPEADDPNDGWEDMDDDAPAVASTFSRIQAAQQRPIQSQPKQSGALPNGPASDRLETSTSTGSSRALSDEDDPWGSMAAPVPSSKARTTPASRATPNSDRLESSSSKGLKEEDDLWGAMAAPPPSTKVKPLATTITGSTKVRQGQHVSLGTISGPGRGRGRSGPMKLGAQKITRSET